MINPNLMSIGDILEKIDEILVFHLMLNGDAMKACHMLGFNGFKRMHRWNVSKFTKLHLKLENKAVDQFRMMLDADIKGFKYQPANLKDHLQKWDAKLHEDINELARLNNLYREIGGTDNRIVTCAMKKMCRNYEKIGRWLKRFEEGGWSSHDIHYVDDMIHAKYKKMEIKNEKTY